MHENKTIIVSDKPLEVGRRYVGCTDPNGELLPEQSFIVVAEATSDDYERSVPAHGGWCDPAWFFGEHFYEVLTD